jgi:hypothetical protein
MILRGAVASILVASVAAGAPPLVFNFDTDPQGWSLTDHPCGGPYATPLSSGAVVWAASGGDPAGHIQAADPSSNCYFVSSPALGDLSAFRGGVLGFSLRTTLNNYADENTVVLVPTSGSILVGLVTPQPSAAWTRYRIQLQPSSFRVGSRTGPVATQAQFDAALAANPRLRISAEYGLVVAETTSLDSVAFAPAPCLGDANFDGVVNFADVTTVLSSYGNEYPLTGFGDASGDGAVSFVDITTVLANFGATCA